MGSGNPILSERKLEAMSTGQTIYKNNYLYFSCIRLAKFGLDAMRIAYEMSGFKRKWIKQIGAVIGPSTQVAW